MSNTNGYGWKPRKTEALTCPSGQGVTVRRPGPEFMLRSGRVARTFSAAIDLAKKIHSESTEEQKPKGPEDIFAEMSDEELAAVVVFARELVCAMLVSPKLVLNPDPAKDEVGPDDVPGEDFWFLFNYGMENFSNVKVPVGESEVEVSDLQSFREEPSVSGDSVDGVHVPITEPEREATNQGLVGSTGV